MGKEVEKELNADMVFQSQISFYGFSLPVYKKEEETEEAKRNFFEVWLLR